MNALCFDTRDLRPGDMFVALRTGRRDGHEFLSQALEAGATAALVEKQDMRVNIPQLLVDDTLEALHRVAAETRKAFRAPVVGITGSCGKTSTKDLLSLLLGPDVICTQGNYNNFIGMPLTLSRLCAGHSAAVVELGISQKGEMEPLARILDPDIAIVTSVAPAHLAGLGDMEGVASEKAGLPSVMGRDKRVLFPAYCLQWAAFCDLRARCFVTASMDEDTPLLPGPNYELVRYQTFRSACGGSDMLLFMPGQESFERFRLPRSSTGMRSNAALALAAALDMGAAADDLRARLPQWKAASMRGELRHIGIVDYYVDCYNANPASMLDSVQLFRETFPQGRRLFMLGCMNELGAESELLHRQLGERIGALDGESFCIVGPASEALRDGLVQAGARAESVHLAADPAQAKALLDTFRNGCGSVLLKGSRSYRMEDYLPQDGSEKETAQC
ncbi:MAG: UDP-N-acetylmuramoyl-tripeptide--D-alanyl-D-alanine ligase [Opitutales bacterium]